MSWGSQLLDLQEVENGLRDSIGAYKQIQKQLSETTPERQAREGYEQAIAAEREARARQQNLNLEWQGMIQKIDEEEKRLYSGEVKNPKELSNLQLEVEMLKKQREKLEEQALALIEEVDEWTSRAAATKAAYEKVEQDQRDRQISLEEQEKKLKRQISIRRAQREKMLVTIDPTALEQYRYVQRLKNDTHAVSTLREGVCTSCHIEVSAAKRDTVERVNSETTKLVTCGNCGRILVN
ncbi:MAG: hypothetical protein H0T73_16470 [Ardenticatenales bacterium]|nr:hypothetical protein [Ardenticatenales bacterium]